MSESNVPENPKSYNISPVRDQPFTYLSSRQTFQFVKICIPMRFLMGRTQPPPPLCIPQISKDWIYYLPQIGMLALT